MATSGSYDFTQTRDQIISRALRLAGATASNETPSASLVSDATIALNAMVKHWQATGIHIWRTVEAILFLQQDQVRYALGTSASDHATENYTETALAADAASGATSISVDSATGLTVSDNIGIQVDDGSIHWTTISSISGTTITLASGLDDTATDGAVVVAYTTKLVRPLKVLSARRYNWDADTDTPMREFDRDEYQSLPLKTNEATPTGFFYDRRGGANATGLFYAWPQPGTTEDAVKMTVARPIQDFDAAGDNPDLPVEWIQAITFNLAEVLAPEFDCPLDRLAKIEKQAAKFLAEVTWSETELETIQLIPGE
jgi:hypothetical protein